MMSLQRGHGCYSLTEIWERLGVKGGSILLPLASSYTCLPLLLLLLEFWGPYPCLCLAEEGYRGSISYRRPFPPMLENGSRARCHLLSPASALTIHPSYTLCSAHNLVPASSLTVCLRTEVSSWEVGQLSLSQPTPATKPL